MAAYARTIVHVRDGLVDAASDGAAAMSMLGPTVVLAVREIRRHLLRSFLTMLGIVIGVAAVVTMVTLGNGATAAVREQISGLGANILQIRPGQGFGRGGGGPAPPDFDIDDVEAIRDQVAGVVACCAAGAVARARRCATPRTGRRPSTAPPAITSRPSNGPRRRAGSSTTPRSRPARRSA